VKPPEIKLFCSYSHRDEALRDELAKHLKLFERQGLVQSWHDRKIGAGDLWQEAIDRGLREADIILLLISADFLASDYCFDIEMKKALDRHAAGEALVIPVILRPVDWRATPFSKLQALPADGRPVTTFENLDIALEQVAQGVRRAIEGMREKRQASARWAAEEPARRAGEKDAPPNRASSFPPLPAARLDPIAKLLAHYIGPIASDVRFPVHGPILGVGRIERRFPVGVLAVVSLPQISKDAVGREGGHSLRVEVAAVLKFAFQ
jgi:hypothetical protein